MEQLGNTALHSFASMIANNPTHPARPNPVSLEYNFQHRSTYNLYRLILHLITLPAPSISS
jgi:hypothetical protein